MKRALVSVANKENLEIICKRLVENDYEIISTGSTANEIQKIGFDVLKVSDIINFEEILGGRVKTLHPNIHGGILSRRTEEDDKELKDNDIQNIDVVVCNLYPFEEVIQKDGITYDEAIENIDIGGVTLIRAAAKNNKYVKVICDPKDYEIVELTSNSQNRYFAIKAFEHTAYYDTLIFNYLKSDYKYENSEIFLAAGRKKLDLRYGENSHQEAAYYETLEDIDYSLKNTVILHGKELSYNNIKDIDVAFNFISEFTEPTAIAFKHNTPCGVGFGKNINDAYLKCLEMDDVSIFGGIVVLNKEVNIELAIKMNEIFLEVIIAPSYSSEALEKLKEKKNLRILKSKMNNMRKINDVISVNNGYLVQNKDQNDILREEMQIVTNQTISKEEKVILQKAQIVCKYVKSNAIVVADKDGIISQGGGQTSRIDAAKIALEKAKEKGKTKDLFLASDAFFPFDDNVELASKYGVKAIIQPGGSIRDEQVIEKANELNIAMIFTGVRHFKH